MVRQGLRHVGIVLCVGFVCFLGASCGDSYELQSISITPSTGLTLSTPGETEAISVIAYFSNSKSLGVTHQSSYMITAPDPGMISTAPDGAVLYEIPNLISASPTVLACTFSGGVNYPYTVTASYTRNGVTKTASIPVTVTDGCP